MTRVVAGDHDAGDLDGQRHVARHVGGDAAGLPARGRSVEGGRARDFAAAEPYAEPRAGEGLVGGDGERELGEGGPGCRVGHRTGGVRTVEACDGGVGDHRIGYGIRAAEREQQIGCPGRDGVAGVLGEGSGSDRHERRP